MTSKSMSDMAAALAATAALIPCASVSVQASWRPVPGACRAEGGRCHRRFPSSAGKPVSRPLPVQGPGQQSACTARPQGLWVPAPPDRPRPKYAATGSLTSVTSERALRCPGRWRWPRSSPQLTYNLEPYLLAASLPPSAHHNSGRFRTRRLARRNRFRY